MIHKNLTPFHFGPKVTSTRPPQPEMTVCVRGTFALRPGEPVEVVEDPLEQGFMTGDVFADDDVERTGALLYASDFADFKPHTDLLLAGTCYPPDGSAPECPVKFGVGDWSKTLLVVGPRVWKPRVVGRTAKSEAAPFEKMPLGYDNAWGGPEYSLNPGGKGFGTQELPTIEHVDRPVRGPRDKLPPAGFGPLNPLWPQRADKRGKRYGKAYRKQRAPFYSEDFDWTFFNAAPPDQQLPGYLRGDEELVFQNLHPEVSLWTAALPGLRVRAFVKDREREFREVEMRLDTLFADLDEGRLYLTWRGLTPVQEIDLGDVSVVLIASERLGETPRDAAHYRGILEQFEGDPVGLKEHMPEGFLEHVEKLKRDEAAAASGKPPEIPAVDGLDPLSAFIEHKMGPLMPEQKSQLLQQIAGVREKVGPDFDDMARQMVKRLVEAPPFAPPTSTPGQLPRLQLGQVMAQVKVMKEALLGQGASEPNVAKLDGILRNPIVSQLDPSHQREGGSRPARDADESGGESMRDYSGEDLRNHDFSGRDLSAARFVGARLENASFEGAILTRADFSGANLSGAKMTAAVLYGAALNEADLRGADLSMAVLDRVRSDGASFEEAVLELSSFSHASLARTRMRNAKARQCQLVDADLEGVDARGADFSRAQFDNSQLTGSDFSGAKLAQASFRATKTADAKFNGADLTNAAMCQGADFSRSRFVDVKAPSSVWQTSNLSDADFSYADLRESHLEQCKATNANFFAVELKGASLRKADLEGARFVQTNLCGAILNDSRVTGALFVDANCYDAKLLGVALDEMGLTRTDLSRTVKEEA